MADVINYKQDLILRVIIIYEFNRIFILTYCDKVNIKAKFKLSLLTELYMSYLTTNTITIPSTMIEVQTCGHEETIDSAQITIRLIRGIDAVQSRNKKKITVYIHGMSRLILTYR